MKYLYLGNTGIQVSRLCMGTMTFGKEADADESKAIYSRCRDAGVNFFDCADIYVRGESERLLGRLISGHRDEVVITSKAYFPAGSDLNARGSGRRHLMASIDASLKRLGTDRVEVYFLHRWDPTTPIEESLRAMDDIVSQGKALHIGASNFAAWQIAKALGISDRRSWSPIQVIEPMYSLLKRQAEVEILPLAKAENLGVISYNPLGGGLLTGKYGAGASSIGARGAAPSAGPSRLSESEIYTKRYGDERTLGAAAAFAAEAASLGIHPATLAVAWAAAHPAVTAPILGARSAAQVEPSLKAMDFEMTPELYARIAALTPTPPPATDRNEEA